VTVQEVMTSRWLVWVRPEDDLMFTARLMSRAGARHMPVCRGRRLAGIFTDHDYLRYRDEVGPGGRDATVGEFMTAQVVTVRPDDPVAAASALMRLHGIGCLAVVDDRQELIGVVTAGDLLAADVRASARRIDDAVSIGEVMTRAPLTARPYQPVLEAAAMMAERGFKHVPIVDDGGHLVGMITDRDVRTAIGDPAEALGRELTELENLPISSVMTTPAESVGEAAGLVEVAERLAHESIGALPVVDGEQRVIGIVSYADVVRKLLDLVTSHQRRNAHP
jgi:CBS domain-containing protein